jgi:hypothetical protein
MSLAENKELFKEYEGKEELGDKLAVFYFYGNDRETPIFNTDVLLDLNENLTTEYINSLIKEIRNKGDGYGDSIEDLKSLLTKNGIYIDSQGGKKRTMRKKKKNRRTKKNKRKTRSRKNRRK